MATQNSEGVPKLSNSTLEIIRVDTDKIILSWGKALVGVPNPNDYSFYIAWSPDPNPDKVFGNDAFSGMKTKFTITGLKPKTKYIVSIACRNRNDDYIGQVDITIKTTETPTAPPLQIPKLDDSTVKYTRVDDEAIKVSWKKALDGISNTNDYVFELVWAARENNPKNTIFYNRMSNVTEYTITGLMPKTRYTIWLKCNSMEGDEKLGETMKDNITTEKPVPKLTNSTLDVLRIDTEKIILSWEKALEGVPNPNDYSFYIAWSPDPNPDKVFGNDAFSGMKTKFTITGLKPKTKYLVSIACRNRNDDYIGQVDKTITTTDQPTAPPLQIPILDDSTVKITRIDAETIKVSWEKALEGISNLEDYVFELVWYATENNPKNTIFFNRLSNVTEYTITGLQPSIPYGVRINCYSVEGDERLAQSKTKTV